MLCLAMYTFVVVTMRIYMDSGNRKRYASDGPFAHVHTASGTLRPHREVFAVDANGTRPLRAAV